MRKRNKELPRGTEKILVVDDDEAVLHLCKMILESLGYKTVVESCPQTALSHFTGRPTYYDLVITDFEMTPCNGARLASDISRIRPDIPIIAYTGSPAQAQRHDVFRNVMEKPSSLEEMAVTIRQVLDFGSAPLERVRVHDTV